MARSFTNLKVLSTLVADALTRRGYAAATQSATRGGGAASMSGKMAPKKKGDDKVSSGEKVSWVPDPVTGCYKPENTKEIDVAELRATLLAKK
ncbi:hypothetical protein RJT34_22779 [Clitoria ternatea]|uniref:Indole-3-acetic acid-induced protein ARG2 n=1 Tax=Clitoria ternatea TaxID=43366 RepID=A0AAN9IFW1_CLITE